MAYSEFDRIASEERNESRVNFGGLTSRQTRRWLRRSGGRREFSLWYYRLADEPGKFEGLPEQPYESHRRAFVESFGVNQMIPKRLIRRRISSVPLTQLAMKAGKEGSLLNQSLPFGRRLPVVGQDLDRPASQPDFPVFNLQKPQGGEGGHSPIRGRAALRVAPMAGRSLHRRLVASFDLKERSCPRQCLPQIDEGERGATLSWHPASLSDNTAKPKTSHDSRDSDKTAGVPKSCGKPRERLGGMTAAVFVGRCHCGVSGHEKERFDNLSDIC